MGPKFKIREKVWIYPGEAAWYFVSLDKSTSDEIREIASTVKRRGWGSVKVRVEAKDISWETSVFPDKGGVYLLPLKAEVRKKLGVGEGGVLVATLFILL